MTEEERATFTSVKHSAGQIALLTDEQRNNVLKAVADAIETKADVLLDANRQDLANCSAADPLYDRLQLDQARLSEIAAQMRKVATLPSPVGRTIAERMMPNGLHLRKVSVPFGVIGMIYEARPNVTFDVFSLCFKSGNACILKGGKAADNSCRAGVKLIHDVLQQRGLDTACITLLPATHTAAATLLEAVGYVDLCIPRGGRRLIDFVRTTAKVPVIETGAGVVHCYFDMSADLDMGRRIVDNAKTRRPSVCNTLDTLIIHRSRLNDLPALCVPLGEKGVVIHADTDALKALSGHYPDKRLIEADDADWDTEWLSLQMGIVTVDSLEGALAHIARHGSGHSESIVADDVTSQRIFEQRVDAACVYVNAPTSFTDGAQFGFGAEIGISTQKLGPRGPMGLEELTTYKWLIEGNGQVRP